MSDVRCKDSQQTVVDRTHTQDVGHTILRESSKGRNNVIHQTSRLFVISSEGCCRLP